jgi:hypothetical protein
LAVDVAGKHRPPVVQGDDHPEELEPGVRPGSDLLVGLEQIVRALEREVRRLDRNQEMRRRRRRR